MKSKLKALYQKVKDCVSKVVTAVGNFLAKMVQKVKDFFKYLGS